MVTHRSLLRFNIQRRCLGADDGLFAVALEGLDMALDPGFSPLDLHRLCPENEVFPRRRRLPVVDVEIGRHADLVGQRREAAKGQAFVEDGGQEASVNDAGMTADVVPEVKDRDERLPTLLVPGQRRHNDLAGTQENAGGEVIPLHDLGELQVRPRLGEVGVLAERLGQGMVLDVIVDSSHIVVRGFEVRQRLGVRGAVQHALGHESLGYDEADGREEDSESGKGEELPDLRLRSTRLGAKAWISCPSAMSSQPVKGSQRADGKEALTFS